MWLLDLKTVPDPAAAKRLLTLERFSDAEALLAMITLRVARQQVATQPTQLRRVAAAVLLRLDAAQITVIELDDADGEATLLTRLEATLAAAPGPVWAWDAAQHYRSQLLARALAHGLALPGLLAGQGPQSLAAHFGFAAGTASLSELAAVHGLPHRLGLRAADAEAAHSTGDRARLRAGSAADAMIAALLALACQMATGERDATTVLADRQRLRDWMTAQAAPHWREFLRLWKS